MGLQTFVFNGFLDPSASALAPRRPTEALQLIDRIERERAPQYEDRRELEGATETTSRQ